MRLRRIVITRISFAKYGRHEVIDGRVMTTKIRWLLPVTSALLFIISMIVLSDGMDLSYNKTTLIQEEFKLHVNK